MPVPESRINIQKSCALVGRHHLTFSLISSLIFCEIHACRTHSCPNAPVFYNRKQALDSVSWCVLRVPISVYRHRLFLSKSGIVCSAPFFCVQFDESRRTGILRAGWIHVCGRATVYMDPNYFQARISNFMFICSEKAWICFWLSSTLSLVRLLESSTGFLCTSYKTLLWSSFRRRFDALLGPWRMT